MRTPLILDALVAAMRAGEWTEASVLARCTEAVDSLPSAAGLAIASVVRSEPARTHHKQLREALVRALRAETDAPVADAAVELDDHTIEPVDEFGLPCRLFATTHVRRYYLEPKQPPVLSVPMLPAATLHDLAIALHVEGTTLARFASPRPGDDLPADSPARDYRARWVDKRRGGARLIEAPKARLASVQRRLLDRMLFALPVHDAAYGFVRGRSALDHARLHQGNEVVLVLDLEDFFGSISRARVSGLLRAIGYHAELALEVARIVTTRTPLAVIERHPYGVLPHESVRRLREPHLPQGAPTSPVLANAAARFLDSRLTGLAASAGLRYSRYADDLAFSGPRSFHRHAEAFATQVAAIAIDEGFRVQHRKTRCLSAGRRQRITGYVVNEQAQVSRQERERLEAILVNCVRHGARSQNRALVPDFAAHLRGRIAHVQGANPRHARRMQALFDAIDFGGDPDGITPT